MKKIPSDQSLMEEIFNRYYESFKNYSKDSPDRETKIYMPIDIEAIAKHFNTDVDIIFGRLYYHLDKKYSYDNKNGSTSPLFTKVIGKDKNAVNFPLMVSILSGMKEESNRQSIAIFISIIAITISLLTFALNSYKLLSEPDHDHKIKIVRFSDNTPEYKITN